MLFLIEYDRSEGKLLTLREFDGSEWQAAHNARLELELDLNRRGIQHEVVILDAPNEEALRRTHGRYFKDFAELAGEQIAKL
jgi:hypothetical protein